MVALVFGGAFLQATHHRLADVVTTIDTLRISTRDFEVYGCSVDDGMQSAARSSNVLTIPRFSQLQAERSQALHGVP